MKSDSVKSNTIEWLRFLCIVAVVFIHVDGKPLDGNDVISCRFGVYDTIRILISEGLCRLAVPIFFIISGYLFFVGMEEWNMETWVNKLRKRVKTILVPYVLWNVIAICFTVLALYLGFITDGSGENWYQYIGGPRAFWSCDAYGQPVDYPLWFIRDLMVIVILTPIIFQFVKRTGIVGLSVLYLLYVFQYWIEIPGFSSEGFFFFALGAYFSIHNIDFTVFFRNKIVIVTVIACLLFILRTLTAGYHDVLYGYVHRLFKLFGSASTIGVVAFLFERNLIKVNPFLSTSSFFIFAAHEPILLPGIRTVLSGFLPANQIGLIVRYFSAPAISIAILVLCYYCLRKLMPRTTSVLMGGRTG